MGVLADVGVVVDANDRRLLRYLDRAARSVEKRSSSTKSEVTARPFFTRNCRKRRSRARECESSISCARAPTYAKCRGLSSISDEAAASVIAALSIMQPKCVQPWEGATALTKMAFLSDLERPSESGMSESEMTPSKGCRSESSRTERWKPRLRKFSIVTSQSGISAMRRSAPEATLRLLE